MTYRPSLAIALVALGGTASAGTELAPSPPVDAALTVGLTGKSTYAMGEIIPLELEFRGRAGPDYFFSGNRSSSASNAVVNALLDGRAFSLTKEETERRRERCLTRACRDNVDARARSRPAR